MTNAHFTNKETILVESNNFICIIDVGWLENDECLKLLSGNYVPGFRMECKIVTYVVFWQKYWQYYHLEIYYKN